MNKKGAFSVLALVLLMTLAAVPVMAEPATKVPASTHRISTTNTFGPVTDTTPSGIIHMYAEYTNQRTLTIDDTVYDVYVVGSMNVVRNPQVGSIIVHFTAVWYVGSLTTPTPNGFSGNLKQKGDVLATPAWAESHMVFQGFGSFAQSTLKLNYDGALPGAMDLSGYCIIP
jgi:hypothetical protein